MDRWHCLYHCTAGSSTSLMEIPTYDPRSMEPLLYSSIDLRQTNKILAIKRLCPKFLGIVQVLNHQAFPYIIPSLANIIHFGEQ